MGFRVLRAGKAGCARGGRGGAGGERERAADNVCFLGPRLHHHHVLTQTVRVRSASHHTGRHIGVGPPSTLLAPHVLHLCPLLPHPPAHGAHRVGGAATIRLEHARWARAFAVSQGSTRQFLDHRPGARLTALVAFLDAILVSGKGPRGAAAADTQAYVGTVLGHVGSCRTLVTGEHLAGDAVDVVVFANETWCLLLWLSPGGTEESKLKEKKGGGRRDKS